MTERWKAKPLVEMPILYTATQSCWLINNKRRFTIVEESVLTVIDVLVLFTVYDKGYIYISRYYKPRIAKHPFNVLSVFF